MSALIPHWFQREAIASVPAYFELKGGNPVVAMPTGTGKSVVIALLIRWILSVWPRQRIMVLTHVKELVEQNAKRMLKAWPEAPMGIYSAGLKMRDTVMPITFAGVASVHGRVQEFGWRDLIFIDEAHLLSPNDNSMYQKVIAEFKKINPMLKVVGFTATPYRLGQGLITDGGLFTDICYDITGMAAFNRLINEGFMSPLVTKKTNSEIDTSGLSVAAGDFKIGQLEDALSRVVIKACEELCRWAYDRDSILIFAPGVKNSIQIAELMNRFGVPTAAVHSNTKDYRISDAERDRRIEDFKSFKLKCVVNNNVLTTGFDHPGLDCIGMMRPTLSPGLWVQMLGRGTRVSVDTGKRDCLVLDFAGNTRNLGPINDPVIPKRKGAGGGDAPVRICPTCGTYNHASMRRCCCCDMEFDFSPNIAGQASTAEVLRTEAPIIETLPVKMVLYSSYTKRGKENALPCMRVQYITGIQRFDEWVHLEAPYASIPGKKARDWWRTRHPTEPPATVSEALAYQQSLKVPKFIRVAVNRKYPEILGYEYE